MDLIEKAWGDLRQNPVPVALYLAVTLFLAVAWSLTDWLFINDAPMDNLPDRVIYIQFAFAVIESLVFSAIQAISFARLGREIDKPLWKCRDDREALQRFFVLWLILNLMLYTLLHLMGNAIEADNESLASMLRLLHMIFFVLFLPVGACIMYHGALKWEELGQALRPIAAQPPLVIIVFMIMLAEYMLSIGAILLTAIIPEFRYFIAPVHVLASLMDCLAFAAMWRICMAVRDSAFMENSDPYDF